MYRNGLIRVSCILLFGLACTLSPPGPGFPWWLDAFLWEGLRDITNKKWVPLAAAGVVVVADCAGWLLPRVAVRVRRPGRWALAVAVLGGALLWMLRVHRWFGDLPHIDEEALPRQLFETAEPLGALTYYFTTHWGTALGFKASTSIAALTVVFGASALAAVFLWARLLSEEWPLIFAMIASTGAMVLFCGYPEKGTPKSVALACWYIYLATRTLREGRTWLVAVSSFILSVGALMHGSVLCLLPAHAWYVWRRGTARQVALGVVSFLAPIALTVAAVLVIPQSLFGSAWGNIAAPWQWIKQYCITNCGYDFWSAGHAADVIDTLLVLSPLATLCLPEALLRSRDETGRWLALGSLGCLFLSVTWFPVFGYVPDWDIFTLTPLIMSFLAIYIGVTQMPPAGFRRLACAWIVGSLLHAASWWRYFQLPL